MVEESSEYADSDREMSALIHSQVTLICTQMSIMMSMTTIGMIIQMSITLMTIIHCYLCAW